MKKKFWTSDKLVGVIAVLISLTTLFIFVKQTNIIEEQSRMSVMPYLSIETNNNPPELSLEINIVNYGVGPAIVEEIRILYKDATYPMDFVEFSTTQFREMDSISLLTTSSLHAGITLSVGESRTLIKAGGNEEDYQAFLELMARIENDPTFDYEIIYKSIYGDRWLIRNSNDFPTSL